MSPEPRPSFWWFARASFAYKAEKSWRSKYVYARGLFPAWRRWCAQYETA
jgi:hypothetical protein